VTNAARSRYRIASTDVADLADASKPVESFQFFVGVGVVSGCPDDAERDGVVTDSVCGVFDRQ
jgi:hypothetical protein